MEEMLVYLAGAGAVLLAPLVPGLRPLVKTAIKGGMKTADATRDVAARVGHTWREVVQQANDEYAADNHARAEARAGVAIPARSGTRPVSDVVIDADARVVDAASQSAAV